MTHSLLCWSVCVQISGQRQKLCPVTVLKSCHTTEINATVLEIMQQFSDRVTVQKSCNHLNHVTVLEITQQSLKLCDSPEVIRQCVF